MQGEGTRVYRVRAVAEMFDVSPSTIYRAISAGRLEAYKIGQGLLRVPEHALAVFTEECAEAAYQAYVQGDADPGAEDRQDGDDPAGRVSPAQGDEDQVDAVVAGEVAR